MSKIRDEKTKLLAGFLNTVAGAMVSVGAIAPFAAFLYGLAPASVDPVRLVLGTGGFLAAGAIVHYIALRVLDRLTP